MGDSDGDGTWDVIQVDENGRPFFFDTGVPIALQYTLTIEVDGPDLGVLIDGMRIFDGAVIDIPGSGFATILDGIFFESVNNVNGFGSVITVDNIRIDLIPAPGVAALLAPGAILMSGRRRRQAV